MKKLMILAIAAVQILGLSAKNTIKIGTNDVDAVTYCTKLVASPYIGMRDVNIVIDDPDDEIHGVCDEILASGNCMCRAYYHKFPKCIYNLKEVYLRNVHPNAYTNIAPVIEKYSRQETLLYSEETKIHMFDAAINMERNGNLNSWDKKYILQYAPSATKKTLRRQGKSFVDKDGISPVQSYVDAVSDALNAPKYAGLQKALTDIGLDYGLNFTHNWKFSDAEIADMKEQIMNGDKNFDSESQRILNVYLGVEEYNKFVKEYNEGTQE